MSSKYESGGNAGSIARTKGDIGGASYGTYQLTTASGSAKSFVDSLKNVDKAAYIKLVGKTPGTAAFDAAWKSVAAGNPNFGTYQHDYIQQKYFDPAVSSVKKTIGLDVTKRSQAVQDAIWSTAVQHGSGSVSKILKNAGVNTIMNDAEIIRRIYAERAAGNGSKYFSSSSTAVRNSVVKRFGSEMKDALNMLT